MRTHGISWGHPFLIPILLTTGTHFPARYQRYTDIDQCRRHLTSPSSHDGTTFPRTPSYDGPRQVAASNIIRQRTGLYATSIHEQHARADFLPHRTAVQDVVTSQRQSGLQQEVTGYVSKLEKQIHALKQHSSLHEVPRFRFQYDSRANITPSGTALGQVLEGDSSAGLSPQ